MIVSPELISAKSAPCARPLNNCDRKLGQLIMPVFQRSRSVKVYRRTRGSTQAARAACRPRRILASVLRVVAELATKRVGLLHQRRARHDFGHLPEIFLVLHVARLLAANDDHRSNELMVGGTPVHLADE